MATTTTKAIRDRIKVLVAALTPALHATPAFVAYTDENGADFRRWARSHPSVCTRRFQARTRTPPNDARLTLTILGLAPGEVPSMVVTVPLDEKHKALVDRLLGDVFGNAPVAPLTTRGG